MSSVKKLEYKISGNFPCACNKIEFAFLLDEQNEKEAEYECPSCGVTVIIQHSFRIKVRQPKTVRAVFQNKKDPSLLVSFDTTRTGHVVFPFSTDGTPTPYVCDTTCLDESEWVKVCNYA